jgi:predicted metal-dependent hydrolase
MNQPELRWLNPAPAPDSKSIELDGRRIPVLFRRNDRARRYHLYLNRGGVPCVTIPRRGTWRYAQQFLERHQVWLTEQLRRYVAGQVEAPEWTAGSEVFFRGSLVRLEPNPSDAPACLWLGSESVSLPPNAVGGHREWRRVVENHLRRLAGVELTQRVWELAAQHQSPVRRVTIRAQRTRWGSCSESGTVSLNWRLVQVPIEVRDYVILHELMHLNEMNHSPRFWALVAQACPSFRACKAWLRAHSSLLL